MKHTVMVMDNDKVTVQQLLLELGYSTAEAETYWALLNLDSVSIRKVAALSGINRGSTYDAIKQLVTAGLVTRRRSGEREYYTAESPEKIYDLIRDKRKELWNSQLRAQKVIPELLARKAKPQGRPLVKYFEDDSGVVTILRDVLQTTSQLPRPEYYVYSSAPLRQYLYRKFPEFTERRIADNIAVKVIAIGEGGDPAAVSERKWLPESSTTDNQTVSSYTLIYGDKFAVISISNDNTPYGVVIEDAGTASMQRLLFDRLWDTLV
jgi:sugar-specific transcriptional regulator TrmB